MGRRALQWYRKSSAGGFDDANKAVDEAEDFMKRKAEQVEKEKFDPSIFQNPRFMTEMYNNTFKDINTDFFIYYAEGFVGEIGGSTPLFINGTSCMPQVRGGTTSALLNLLSRAVLSHTDSDAAALLSGRRTNTSSDMVKFTDQGKRDAIALFNRYGCDGNVTHTVMENINAQFDSSYRRPRPASGSNRVTKLEPTPITAPRAHKTPSQFNCNNAMLGVDYVVCSSPQLMDADGAPRRGLCSRARVARRRDQGLPEGLVCELRA